ncbi:hypothetical protein [Burkholderia sp. Z1]|uniref:hypothetical protein n=1 Tax=Burkholderia sp. Z1 TaxID=2759039 RepID=UPI0018670F8D|nr:hypothetical protein [Burkholderia sp. Z1]
MLLPKPLFLTFQSEEEGDAYAARLEQLLGAGIVPADVVEQREAISTTLDAIRQYRRRVSAPDSDARVLDTLLGGRLPSKALTAGGLAKLVGRFAIWHDDLMRPISRSFSLVTVLLLTACAARPAATGEFFVGDHPVKVEALKRSDVYALLVGDWERFDTHVKDAPDFMTGKTWPVNWYLRVTPPFPTSWPPQQFRSVTYYAYAEYQELFRHGPTLSRSAPWAKVTLNEGRPATEVILSTRIGPVVSGEGSVPITQAQAERKKQIVETGESYLSDFVSWQAIPDNETEVKAIRQYYCQWILTNRTADLIENNHRAFFEWLSCPPRTLTPVLGSSR